MFVTLTGRGHDAFVCRITCKKARIWTFFWLDRKQYKWFALFQLVTLARVMSSEYTSSLWNFCRLSFHEFEECLNRNSSIEIFSISSFTPIIWNLQFWVCCSILFCPRLSESLEWRDSQRLDSNHDKKSAFKRFKAKCFQSKPGHLSVNSYKTEELRLFHLYKINK